MPDPDTTPVACPPHHWEILSREIDRVVHDFHRCLRCDAEKDVPRRVGGDLTMSRQRGRADADSRGLRFGRGAARPSAA